MGKWYGKSSDFIDARLAYDGAGAMGRGISSIGGAMSNYAKLDYQKKRAKQEDRNLANTNAAKIKTHEIDYLKSTDTAKIKSDGDIQVAKINDGSGRYIIDRKKDIAKIDYLKSTDTAKITGKAKVKSSKISADAKIYGANISAENNKRTTSTLRDTTKVKSKAQQYVADKSVESAKIKSKPKKKESWKIQALKNAKTAKEREAILKMKDIGDKEI